MKTIQFHAVVGPDQMIRPPVGVCLPEGEIEVSVRVRAVSARVTIATSRVPLYVLFTGVRATLPVL